jgi:PAS domain S-box-containing protein
VSILITGLDGKIEYVNPKFTEITGYSFEEAVRPYPNMLKSGIQDSDVYDKLWQTITSGNQWFGELQNRKKNGELYWESESISPIVNPDGKVTHFVAVKEDITAKKKLENDLITAKELAQESDKLKTAFLNNISHEIRTPFNSMLGLLSILQDEALTVRERDTYISAINQGADRLMNTINDIVEISRIQTGQIEIYATETNIKSLTVQLLNHFKDEAELKKLGISINNDIPDGLECILTDKIKLITILSGLIVNALKFTQAGSIEFGVQKKSGYLLFFVKDTGIGIPQNKHLAIFKRFIQADSSITRQFAGSGLGLSIAKAYVELLGGKIWVESEPGKGSVFYFTIPCN